ncbi:MAG: phospholipase D family protein [Candidatus Omnitrophica bacterium]|nr:phospholipase D family protein [Candidatus Omnitrophota bacterium]
MKFKRLFPHILVFIIGFGLGIIFIRLTHSPTAPFSESYGIEAKFSPKGGIQEMIIEKIKASLSTIDIAIFDLTSEEIKNAIENARARGVNIRIVADKRQAGGQYSKVKLLREKGFNVKLARGRKGGIMHNKFAIFDGVSIVTGSYNWTKNAENKNFENALFTSDPKVVKVCREEFERIWDFGE